MPRLTIFTKVGASVRAVSAIDVAAGNAIADGTIEADDIAINKNDELRRKKNNNCFDRSAKYTYMNI